MDPNIYIRIYGDHDISGALFTMAENEDELGSVLRIHLLSERMLEAWIAARIEVEDLFTSISSEKLNFKINYVNKLALAKKLGFNTAACTMLAKINSLRNKFAHSHDCAPIDDSVIATMKQALDSIPKHEKIFEIEDQKFTFKPQDSNPIIYEFNSKQTSNRVKLIMLYFSLFTCITIDVIQLSDEYKKLI
ncbi:hypothetical protein [Leclercia adecarboxylata]|uniref:hypothetical protein n=2 Tax=Enterobacteriaceae TaxID=543 RepID=UPI001F06D79B|nr:hypothetical protein [Leclercia adecarboxylata]MCH2683094.1 hypothetical protein [Leclercia adecarboxylata]HCN5210835.1 hypothetical protein [Escherichia coli]